MPPQSLQKEIDDRPQYVERTPVDYLDMLDPEMRSTFTEPQVEAVTQLLGAALPKPTPKLVDLRFWVDLFTYRFYVVLFVGKDRRQQDRSELSEPMARKGNAITALMLLVGLNLLISLFILLIAFSIKSVIGYSFPPDSHVAGQLHKLN